MRAVIQRVKSSSVVVSNQEVGAIGEGMMVLVGAGQEDTESDADYIAKKIVDLRIFEDSEGKMNLSIEDTGGSVLLVSQFTLYGDCRKGRRPSFVQALEPDEAKRLVDYVAKRISERGIQVRTGVFGADMKVELVNDGPVTLLLDSRRLL